MEKLWFYAAGNDRKGPVNESELLALCRQGTIKSTDLVWTEGMADWRPLQSTPLAEQLGTPSEAPAAEAPTPGPAAPPKQEYRLNPVDPVVMTSSPYATQPSALSAIPEGMTGWMKFNGVMLIIQGVMYCLGCIYIIIGAPLIVAGVGLMGAATQLEQTGGVASGTVPFLQKLRTFNLAFGIYHIILLVLIVLLLIGMLFFFGAMTAAFSEAMKSVGGAAP